MDELFLFQSARAHKTASKSVPAGVDFSIANAIMRRLLKLSGEKRRQIAQIVIFTAVGNGFKIFCVTSVGDAYAGDLPLFGHIDCLLLFYNGVVRELVPGDLAAFFLQDRQCVWRWRLPEGFDPKFA